jgi:hypothetical protein
MNEDYKEALDEIRDPLQTSLPRNLWFLKQRKIYLTQIAKINFYQEPIDIQTRSLVRKAARFGLEKAMQKICSFTQQDKELGIHKNDERGIDELFNYACLYDFQAAYGTISDSYRRKKFGTDRLSSEERNRRGIRALKRYAELDHKDGIRILLEAYNYGYHDLKINDPDYRKFSALRPKPSSPPRNPPAFLLEEGLQ